MILSTLAAWGLGTLGKAILSKGISAGCEYLKEKTGVDIDPTKEDLGISNEDRLTLTKFQMEHERELTRMAYDYDLAKSQEVTRRHSSDMQSDSWLSKNIRPSAFAASVLLFVVSAFCNEAIDQTRFDSIKELCIWFGSFYFGARSFDKIHGGSLQTWAKSKFGG